MSEDTPHESDETGLRASARGWHGAQLAVLGFIGLCGVLHDGGGGLPRWLTVTAGLLVLSALALECVAVALVASIAWPILERAPDRDGLGRARRRLRVGVGLTFVSVAVVSLATASSWWPPPSEAEGSRVQVVSGNTVLCGQLRAADPGLLALEIDGRSVRLALRDVDRLEPVDSCG